jgi:hypothetical protein
VHEGFLMNADAHHAAMLESARRERSNNDENDKEQSGAETVKIAAGSPDPDRISTARHRAMALFYNEPDRN